jgi:hypothetical protein
MNVDEIRRNLMLWEGLEGIWRHVGWIWKHLGGICKLLGGIWVAWEASGRCSSSPGGPQIQITCPKEGIGIIPGGSRKPRRKVTTLLPAVYKAINLEAIRLIGPNL